MKTKKLGILMAIATSLVLSACSSGSDSNNKPPERPIGKVSGVAYDGLILDGDVTVYAFDGKTGAVLATAKTDLQGAYSIGLQEADQPVLTKVTGGRYVEEASGITVPLQATQALWAVSNYTTGKPLTVNATFWTTLATGLAQYKIKVGAPVAQAITEANAEISQMLGFDILSTTPKDPTDINNRSAALTPSLEYGFLAAAISKWTAYASTVNNDPTHEVFSSIAFAQWALIDIQYDGVLNGQGSIGALSFGVIPLSASVYRHDLALYIFKMAADGRNVSGITPDKLVATASRLNNATVSMFGTAPVVVMDGGGPFFTEVTPTDNSAVYGTFTAGASITDILGLESFEFLIDSKPVGTASDLSAPQLAINSLGLKDGAYVLTMRATNIAGAVKTHSVNITITNTQTTITNITPTPDSYQRGLTSFKADVSDPTGLESVRFVVDTTNLGKISDFAAPQLVVDTTPFDDGVHTLHVIATNSVGNVVSVDTLFRIDNTSPVIATYAPAPGIIVPGGTIGATAQVVDNNPYDVQFLMDGILLGSAIDKTAATYSINTLDLKEGAHTVGIAAHDLAGNAGVVTIPITIDNTPPMISGVSPSGTFVDASFTAGATISEANLASVDFVFAGVTVGTVVYPLLPTQSLNQTIRAGSVSEGAQTLKVIAKDKAGLVTTATTQVTLDKTSPTTNINAAILNNGQCLFSGTPSDALSGVASVSGTNFYSSGAKSWSYYITPVYACTSSANSRVSVRDNAGNTRSYGLLHCFSGTTKVCRAQ